MACGIKGFLANISKVDTNPVSTGHLDRLCGPGLVVSQPIGTLGILAAFTQDTASIRMDDASDGRLGMRQHRMPLQGALWDPCLSPVMSWPVWHV